MTASPQSPGTAYRLSLLGGFRLETADGRAVVLASRKAQALLAVLALHGSAGLSRERIAALLWEDLEDERARHSLRQALSALRHDVPVVASSGDNLALDAGACAADVAEFRRLASSDDTVALERATSLYTGPLLDGFGARENALEEWLRGERVRLSEQVAAALKRLASQHAASEAHEAAASVLRRLLELDASQEEAHRLLMQSLAAAGRHSEALAQYHACREQLLKHLGVEPGAATRALYESLRDAGAAAPDPEARGMCVIAVLPFSNFARTAALDALASSVAEDIGDQLARTPGFRVPARPAVAAAMQPNPDDFGRLARSLRAKYLVTGSLRQPEPARVRISVQVVDGESLQYVWSIQQDFDAAALGNLDEFVAGTSARIEQQITLAEGGPRGRRPQGKDAWDKMRQAGSALFSTGWSEEAVEASVRLYREAIALDPELALARAQKALIMALARRWGLLRGDEVEVEARADAERALELEPTRSEVLGCAGCAIADLGDPARAVPLLERAIEENPGNAQAWAALGATRLLQGQKETGVEALRRGLRISPTDYRRSIWLTALSGGLARLERLDEALDAAQGACRSDAKFYPACLALAMVLAKLGRDAEAGAALADARRIRPRLTPAEIRLWAGRSLDGLAGQTAN